MRSIFSVISILAKEFKECINEGYDMKNAEELVMDQLTEEEIETYGSDIVQVLSEWKATLQNI